MSEDLHFGSKSLNIIKTPPPYDLEEVQELNSYFMPIEETQESNLRLIKKRKEKSIG